MSATEILRAQECGAQRCRCHASARKGSGLTHCPAHVDPGPSFSVEEKNERTLFHCHAGCPQASVIEALLKLGLWPAGTSLPSNFRHYAVRDSSGLIAAVHARHDRPNGGKDMPWVGTLDGGAPCDLPLYGVERLASLPDGSVVLVCEGEKATEAAWSLGLNAVGTVTGASSIPCDDSLRPLTRLVPVLWPDNDGAGRKHMDAVHSRLALMKCETGWVIWRAAPTKGDAADFVDQGGSAAELSTMMVLPEPPPRLLWRTPQQLAAMTPEGPEWVIEPYLAKGAVTELSAKVKSGKTTLTVAIVGAILTGGCFFGQSAERGAVLYLTEERIPTFVAALARFGLTQETDLHVVLRQDATRLTWPEIIDQAIEQARLVHAHTVVIDTLSDWAGIAGDEENSTGAALDAMRPVHKAAAAGLAVLVVRHDRKSGGELGDSSRGSSAFSGAADILLSLRRTETPGHENRRTLHGVGRFDGIPAQLVIELCDGKYVALGDSADIERRNVRANVIDILPEAGSGMLAESEILELLDGASRSTLKRVLADLVEAGEVVRQKGAGKAGRAFGYALAEATVHLRNVPGQSVPDDAFQGGVSDEVVGALSAVRNGSVQPPPISGQFTPGSPAALAYCAAPDCVMIVKDGPLCAAHGSAPLCPEPPVAQ